MPTRLPCSSLIILLVYYVCTRPSIATEHWKWRRSRGHSIIWPIRFVRWKSMSCMDNSSSLPLISFSLRTSQRRITHKWPTPVIDRSWDSSTVSLIASVRRTLSFAFSLDYVDANFQRLFWTASNISQHELYPVFTCDQQFQQCHDTSVRLPMPWPFAFFNVRCRSFFNGYSSLFRSLPLGWVDLRTVLGQIAHICSTLRKRSFQGEITHNHAREHSFIVADQLSAG